MYKVWPSAGRAPPLESKALPAATHLSSLTLSLCPRPPLATSPELTASSLASSTEGIGNVTLTRLDTVLSAMMRIGNAVVYCIWRTVILVRAPRPGEMDADSLEDYWTEFRLVRESRPTHDPDEDNSNPPDECSDERDWLADVGLSEVTEPAFLSGREVPEAELSRALRLLSRQQAAAVRRRVDSLNKTVRQRARNRQRGDIRQLFRDLENSSNDSRSRSATPDSLDSGPPTPPSPPRELYTHQSLPTPISPPEHHPRLTPGIERRLEARQRLASPHSPFTTHHSLFRRANRLGGDVASETADGIRMTGYQRIGSVRVRFGSDPINISNIGQDNQHPVVCVTRSDEGLFSESSRRDSGDSHHSDTLGFEEMWAGDRLCASLSDMERDYEEGTGRTWVDYLAEEDLVTLRPLVFLELTALMDNSGLRVGKTKPPKRKRKEDGNLFGVSLSTLIERDRQIIQEPHNIPLVFQKVLGEMERRCLWEEGLLRMGGNRSRCEVLTTALEREFYRRPEIADHLLLTAAPHDLACVLKKLLRELPQPLLTSQLLHTFYQAHSIPECSKALNLLVLLLPTEHRATLHALLTFLSSLAANSEHNKMSVQNLAMIMAPSLFPPDILVDKAGLRAELGLAVHCCSLTEVLITATDRLWLVPDDLVAQLRSINESHKENKPKPRLLARKGHIMSRKTAGESEFESNLIHIDAPQFLIAPLAISLDKHMTAAHVILRAVELAREAPRLVKSTRREMKSRALSELAPNGNLSCLLSTGDPDTALRTHFLYEVGGNIGQRRLEPSVKLWAIYQINPQAQWVIRCDHRNGSQRLLRRT